MNANETTAAELPPIAERITVREAARLLDITEDHAYRLAKSGRLSTYRVGKGHIRFLKGEVEAMARAAFQPARASAAV